MKEDRRTNSAENGIVDSSFLMLLKVSDRAARVQVSFHHEHFTIVNHCFTCSLTHDISTL